MKINYIISEIWKELEEQKNIGLVKRLYSSEISFPIYATFQYPDKFYGIAFNFSRDIHIDVSLFNKLSQLKVLLLVDTTFNNSQLLVIQLLTPENHDVFAVLCENLIKSIISIDSELKRSKSIINQLAKWKALFEKYNNNGLSESEQQGLYGELHFLEKTLTINEIDPLFVLVRWVGVDKELRDFQSNDWALEVKTTSTNNPQKITINGERQLDETHIRNLNLFHLSVEVSKTNGQTLCQKILQLRELLKNNIPALQLFNSKLFEVGYFDKHELNYIYRSYKIRSENYYKIENEFPRIKENELRKGISDVRYSIILSMCNEYLIPEQEVINSIILS